MLRPLLIVAILCAAPLTASAQHPPTIGYMFPSGGAAGQTVEVTLGGYDWTPDMQVFVQDSRIRLEIVGPPGPVIVPEPPYWFEKKARRAPDPMPRETRARLTIPAEVSPGIVRWQAANANGATATGRFVVDSAAWLAKPSHHRDASPTHPTTALDSEARRQVQTLAALPVTVSGRIKLIEEVDRYQFRVDRTGPVTCAVIARAMNSPLNAVVEIRDEAGRLIADAADTAGVDTALTFVAEANRPYVVGVYDVDFRGDRSYVYQLVMTPGPRVVAAIPAGGRRGETRDLELVGYGVATGAAKLESVTRAITFPADPQSTALLYRLETPQGVAPPFLLPVSDLPETSEASIESRQLTAPIAVTGVLDERFGEDRYRLAGKKGDVWAIELAAASTSSPLDVALAILDADRKELARGDDLPGSTDAAIEFTAPADGDYHISVTDASGQSGQRTAVYRLSVQTARPDFSLEAPDMLNAPIGGKVNLALKATRAAGFNDPIAISLTGLPAGVSAPAELTLAASQKALNVELTVAADAAAVASLATVAGEVKIGDQTVRHETGPLLVATTLKPPFAIDAEGKDDVTKWPRGTTFPAPVLIQRDAGFHQEIVLEMTSRQGRVCQGINGPELTVPPGVERILYPIFLPEWLETTRTSRMVVNGVAKVADPQGHVRYSVSLQKTRMGFLPTGALLKVAADTTEFQVERGQRFSVPLSISRSPQLSEPVRIELRADDHHAVGFTAEPQTLTADRNQALLSIVADPGITPATEHELTIRATALQNGELPVVSETTVVVQMSP